MPPAIATLFETIGSITLMAAAAISVVFLFVLLMIMMCIVRKPPDRTSTSQPHNDAQSLSYPTVNYSIDIYVIDRPQGSCGVWDIPKVLRGGAE